MFLFHFRVGDAALDAVLRLVRVPHAARCVHRPAATGPPISRARPPRSRVLSSLGVSYLPRGQSVTAFLYLFAWLLRDTRFAARVHGLVRRLTCRDLRAVLRSSLPPLWRLTRIHKNVPLFLLPAWGDFAAPYPFSLLWWIVGLP